MSIPSKLLYNVCLLVYLYVTSESVGRRRLEIAAWRGRNGGRESWRFDISAIVSTPCASSMVPSTNAMAVEKSVMVSDTSAIRATSTCTNPAPEHLKPVLPHVVCDVCREKIEGFVYECRGCNIDLHPSCAKLPYSLRHALHPHHTLQLMPSPSTPYVCNVCGRGFTPREMRYCCCEGSTPCDFILHISCAKLPVDPLEEMRMQSISPLEVPCAHMFTGTPSGTAAATQVRSSSSTGRAAQVIRPSSTGTASSSSTGVTTQAISSLDVLRTGSVVLMFLIWLIHYLMIPDLNLGKYF